MGFGQYDDSSLQRINALIASVGQKHVQNLEASKNQEIKTKQRSDAEKVIDAYNMSRQKKMVDTQPAVSDNTTVATQPTSYRDDYIRTSVQPVAGSVQMKPGTVGARMNNPLNTIYTPTTAKLGASRGELKPKEPNETIQQYWAKYETPETGLTAAEGVLQLPAYQNLTVDQAMKRWSNNSYGGEIFPTHKDKKLSELDDKTLDALVDSMLTREGAGKIVKPSTEQTTVKTTEIDGGRTLPVPSPKLEGNVDNEDEAYNTAYTNLMKMGDNPFAQQAIKQLESLHKTKTEGRLTEKDKADLQYKEDTSKREWEKLERDTKESERKLNLEENKLNEMISNNDDKNEIAKQRIQVTRERQQAREHLEDIFDYDENGNRTVKKDSRSTDITRTRIFVGNQLRAYNKDKTNLLKAIENQDIDEAEGRSQIAEIETEINELRDMNRALNGRPVNSNEKYKSQDDFIKEFEKEYNRKPSDSELEKAKGKYF